MSSALFHIHMWSGVCWMFSWSSRCHLCALAQTQCWKSEVCLCEFFSVLVESFQQFGVNKKIINEFNIKIDYIRFFLLWYFLSCSLLKCRSHSHQAPLKISRNISRKPQWSTLFPSTTVPSEVHLFLIKPGGCSWLPVKMFNFLQEKNLLLHRSDLLLMFKSSWHLFFIRKKLENPEPHRVL